MKNMTMAEFAELWSGPLRTPILDRTNLEARFDNTLRVPPGGGDKDNPITAN
jgi:uncharacterized protein (TIGR03435 family)